MYRYLDVYIHTYIHTYIFSDPPSEDFPDKEEVWWSPPSDEGHHRSYIYMYVCMYLCMYGCMYVCIYIYIYIYIYKV